MDINQLKVIIFQLLVYTLWAFKTSIKYDFHNFGNDRKRFFLMSRFIFIPYKMYPTHRKDLLCCLVTLIYSDFSFMFGMSQKINTHLRYLQIVK